VEARDAGPERRATAGAHGGDPGAAAGDHPARDGLVPSVGHPSWLCVTLHRVLVLTLLTEERTPELLATAAATYASRRAAFVDAPAREGCPGLVLSQRGRIRSA
jgi:hypothetical protein